MDRNPISDLEAIAAMPDLEVLADVVDRLAPFGRAVTTDPLSMVIFLAGRAAFGSANQLTSALSCTELWTIVRSSAARVGRILPETPPTFDQLRHVHRKAGDDLGPALAETLTGPAMDLARAAGFYDPGADRFSRYASVYGDGTVFMALSGVHVEDGLVVGSRAQSTEAARVAETFHGKRTPDGKPGAKGVPIAVVGTHGPKRYERLILGVELFKDRDELAAAGNALNRVIAAGGGGVKSVNYDKLMGGGARRRLMLQNVVPIVPMPAASNNMRFLPVPASLYQRRDKGEVRDKTRVRILYVETASHMTGHGPCLHDLWAVDGGLMVLGPGQLPTLDGWMAENVGFAAESDIDGTTRLLSTYRMPCRQAPWYHVIELTQERITGSGRRLAPLAEYLSPLAEVDPRYDALAGRRNDAESAISWIKRALPLEGRASSLKPEHFLADVVGAALWCNAVCWDVHVARHTRCAQ